MRKEVNPDPESKHEGKREERINAGISQTLRIIALICGIFAAALSIMGYLTPEHAIIVLGLGIAALALLSLEENEQRKRRRR